jgi:hypothetical protein
MTTTELHHEICDALEDLSRLFVPGMKLTFIARFPGNDEADVLVSDDQIPEIIALARRRADAESAAAQGEKG